MKDSLGVLLIVAGIVVIFLPDDDPKLVNYTILAIYLLSAFWWALHKHYWDALYWLSAFSITAVVTFGYKR